MKRIIVLLLALLLAGCSTEGIAVEPYEPAKPDQDQQCFWVTYDDGDWSTDGEPVGFFCKTDPPDAPTVRRVPQ